MIVFRERPTRTFLLMEHHNRLDIPKGHMKAGEDELACALRELEEETGIPATKVRIEQGFKFATTYHPRYRRLGGKRVEKTVVVFLGWLREDVSVVATEHSGFRWVEWEPPHAIQTKTIDPLLREVEKHFATSRRQ